VDINVLPVHRSILILLLAATLFGAATLFILCLLVAPMSLGDPRLNCDFPPWPITGLVVSFYFYLRPTAIDLSNTFLRHSPLAVFLGLCVVNPISEVIVR
jgi:hypothetical protein